MGLAAQDFGDDSEAGPKAAPLAGPLPDRRGAPRVTSLIRAAKLVCGQGEFVCVVRDVSENGVRLRCFHDIPNDPSMALELQNGDIFEIERVRGDGNEASYRFKDDAIPIERLVREDWAYPRRQMRLNVAIPLALRTLTGIVPATTSNVSQQGCRVEASAPLALAQAIIIEGDHLPPIRAKVRWRRNGECGLVFDDTFSLSDLARTLARLQCPALLSHPCSPLEI